MNRAPDPGIGYVTQFLNDHLAGILNGLPPSSRAPTKAALEGALNGTQNRLWDLEDAARPVAGLPEAAAGLADAGLMPSE